MKRLANTFGILLAATCGSASADWVEVGVTEGKNAATVYIDPASIRSKPGHLTVWTMWDYRAPQEMAGKKYWSEKNLYKVRCADNEYAFIQYAEYAGEMGTRDVVESGNLAGDFQQASPGSTGQTLIEEACAYHNN